jgi:hypothetical protein
MRRNGFHEDDSLSTAPADLEAGLAAYRRRDFAEAAVHLERAVAAEPAIAASYRILLAHLLVLAVPWEKVDALVPAGTNALSATGWLESLCQGRPVGSDGRPVPWLAAPAIEFLDARLPPGASVFEWGSGNSTLWWAERAAAVHAVEHDAGWASDMARQLPPHARVVHRPQGPGYAAEIHAFPGAHFDVVVIDGVSRAECAAAAPEHVKPAGMIVYDNSDREAERDGIARLDAAGWLRIDFFGLTPGNLYRNCTSVFFRDAALLRGAPYPHEVESSLGPTCAQAMGE